MGAPAAGWGPRGSNNPRENRSPDTQIPSGKYWVPTVLGLKAFWSFIPASRIFADTPRRGCQELKFGMEKVKSIYSWAGRGWKKPELLAGEAEAKQSIPEESIPRGRQECRQRSLIPSHVSGKTKNRSACSPGNKHSLDRESQDRNVPGASRLNRLQKLIQNSPFLPFSARGTLGKGEF